MLCSHVHVTFAPACCSTHACASLYQGAALSALTEADVPVVDDTWAHRTDGSAAMIAELVRTRPTVAVRVRGGGGSGGGGNDGGGGGGGDGSGGGSGGEGGGDLAAWVLMTEYGALGMLFVKPEYR
jgi:uncharacterized membrane protein YgcG